MKRIIISFQVFCLLVLLTSVYAQTENRFSFTCNPFLQNMQSKGVTVFWEVNRNAHSWIEFGEKESLGSKAISAQNGMTDVNDGIQKIRLENLKEGKTYFYRAASCEVKTLEPYKVIYGDTIFSKLYKFTLPGVKENSFSFLAFNDIHNTPQFIENVVKDENGFAFSLFNGDIFTDLNNETAFTKKIFSPLSNYFTGEKTLYFIRGNHETRGGAARSLYKYIDTPNGKYYYTFTRGNTFFIMMDCGEDKPDNNKNYFGLANYDTYRNEEAKWLENVVKSAEFKKAKFRIVSIHMPVKLKPAPDSEEGHGIYDCSIKFAPILNKAGIDLLLCGHTHKYEVIKGGKESNKFPVIVGGRNYDPKTIERTTYTRVDISPNKITAVLKHIDGKEIEKVEIKK
jgi:acid phosphatase type 7